MAITGEPGAVYYRLHNDYRMRGWQRATSALVDGENEIRKLEPDEFLLLLLCDGEIVLTEEDLTRSQADALRRFLNEGIVEEFRDPRPLADRQKYRLYGNRLVDSAYWSITGRCNYKCRHCYVGAPNASLGEVPHKEAISIIDQMADCGVLRVDLTGGEPLIRGDFWSLVDRILDRDMRVGTLYTNGAHLTKAVLEGFLRRGMRPSISISFDGLGAHDWMRGVVGAEKAALQALELCKEYGFRTDVEMCVHKGNRNTIRDTVNVLSEYGVSALKAAPVSQTALWRTNAEGNELSLRDYFECAIEYIPWFYRDEMPMDVTLSAVACLYRGSTDYKVVPDAYAGCSDEAFEDHYLCASARFNTYIAPDGRLLPCMPMAAYSESVQFPKIQETGLRNGLSGGRYMQFVDYRIRDLKRLNRECAACDYFRRCGGGCRANALSISEIEGKRSDVAAELGDEERLMGRDPYECILFKEGYVDRIYQTLESAISCVS